MTQTFEQIQQDMKDAMRARDKDTTQALRMLVATLKNKRIDLMRDLNEDDVVEVLATEAKRRREAADGFRSGGNEEMAAKEEFELGLIQTYLPAPLTDEEVGAMIDAVIAETGAATKRDMGRVMGQVIPQVKGRFDGARVKDLVLARLA